MPLLHHVLPEFLGGLQWVTENLREIGHRVGLGGGPCIPQSLESVRSFSLEREDSGRGMEAGHSFVMDNPKCSADLIYQTATRITPHMCTSSVTRGPMYPKSGPLPPYL